MKASDVLFNAFLVVMLIYFAISVYGSLFGSPGGYQFTEFGHQCIVVHDGSAMAMWCEQGDSNE